MMLWELSEVINEVCPIDGCNSNGVIWYRPEATEEQKASAQAIMDQNISLLNTED